MKLPLKAHCQEVHLDIEVGRQVKNVLVQENHDGLWFHLSCKTYERILAIPSRKMRSMRGVPLYFYVLPDRIGVWPIPKMDCELKVNFYRKKAQPRD